MSDDGSELTCLVKRGKMLVNRKLLSVDDPESWPMQWVEKFGTIRGFDWIGCYGTEDAYDYKEAFERSRYGVVSTNTCPYCGKTI